MEAAPPSYEKATLVTAWDILAQYIPSSDLCSAALVCQAWHAIFVPHLWGNPASHFGHENDRVYVALTRFKRTLPWARLYVRSLTHTLHLPPAHAELYNGPHADWLREVLERLPNLQSLIVRGLPFFDHAALCALRFKPAESIKPAFPPFMSPPGVQELPAPVPMLGYGRQRALSNTLPTFGLRLLDASKCRNVTAIGLCQALKRLDNLIYLDLSYTYPAKDHMVLNTFRSFAGLQVLKLRGVTLRDEDVEVLSWAIGKRVRNLDIRNNQLTDRSVRALLDQCFAQAARTGRPRARSAASDRSAALLPYMGPDMLAIYQGEEFEAYLRHTFTTSFVSRLVFEDAPEGGITHLYVSDNRLSAEGLAALMRSDRLHVFDANIGDHLASDLKPRRLSAIEDRQSPGVEKLTALLSDSSFSGDGLTYLRIDHEFVTRKAPQIVDHHTSDRPTELQELPSPVSPQSSACQPVAELSGAPTLHELPAQEAIHELPAQETFRAELPGDPIRMIVTPAASEPPSATPQEEETSAQARRGSVFAPEPVSALTELSVSLHPGSAAISVLDAPDISSIASPGLETLNSGNRARARSYSSVQQERLSRASLLKQSEGFHPTCLPNLKELILINVPPHSSDSVAADRIISVIRECAEQASYARQQARLDYTLPPGRRLAQEALALNARQFFALETITLEIAAKQPSNTKSVGSRWKSANNKSMTSDRDSEYLWSAAETDFSFFGDGGETEGSLFPSLEPPRSMFMQAMDGMEVVSDLQQLSFQAGPTRKQHQDPEIPQYDNVARISQFRKARKAVYQTRVACGEQDPEVEGYWPGVIRVVRPSPDFDSSVGENEAKDYYGNTYSQSGIYR